MRGSFVRFVLAATTCIVVPSALVVRSSEVLELERGTSPIANRPRISFGNEELVSLSDDVFADPTTTPLERQRLLVDHAAAVQSVADALGPWQASVPLAVFCKTNDCRHWFGGPTLRSRLLASGQSAPGGRYVAGSRPTVLILRVDEGARGALEHELIHVEAEQRLHGAIVPQWFQEGLAAYLSGAPDCGDRPDPGIEDLRRLDANAAWEAHTNVVAQQHGTYCQAEFELGAWALAHGRAAFAPLLEKLGSGSPFYASYGPLKNCPANAVSCSGPLGVSPPARVRSYSLESHTDAIGDLGVVDQPFTLALWLKAKTASNVLVHGSVNPSAERGWCAPFLGFDSAGRLSAQVLYAFESDAFLSATGPALAKDRWFHVAMSFSPENGVRLYVDGALAASTQPQSPREAHYAAPSRPLYFTLGSDGGAQCWTSSIEPGTFPGEIRNFEVFNYELTPDQMRGHFLRARKSAVR